MGFETIQASVKDNSGYLILRHIDRFVDGVASSQFEVIQSSIEDKLIGSNGDFTSGDNGQADYTLYLTQ